MTPYEDDWFITCGTQLFCNPLSTVKIGAKFKKLTHIFVSFNNSELSLANYATSRNNEAEHRNY